MAEIYFNLKTYNMKRTTLYKHLMVAIFLGCSLFADAQDWRYINSYKGIDVYWRYRKEAYATKYICELKLENTNSYKVQIRFKPRFICANGNEYVGTSNGLTISANSSKGGQYAGLWWYPCEDGKAPAKGGYIDMDVVRQD